MLQGAPAVYQLLYAGRLRPRPTLSCSEFVRDLVTGASGEQMPVGRGYRAPYRTPWAIWARRSIRSSVGG